MSLEVTIIVEIKAVHTSPLDMSTPTEEFRRIYQLDLLNGTAADQADMFWSDQRSTSGSDDLDFEGGLTNAFGVTLNPARVAMLFIANTTAVGGGNAIIGAVGGATALLLGFGTNAHSFAVPPGGIHLVTRPDSSGWATAPGADILRVAASSGTITYDIIAVMKSA